MTVTSAIVANFETHEAADQAVRKLAANGFEMDLLSVVGRGFHTDEKVVGFYNLGDRIKFWGVRGAFWGGLWGLFFGGLFVTIPVAGPVVILGYLASVAASTIEGAALVGGLSAIGATLAGIGVPRDSVIQYESDIVADGFLVMAHGFHNEMLRAREILNTSKPTNIALHHGLTGPASPVRHVAGGADAEKQMA